MLTLYFKPETQQLPRTDDLEMQLDTQRDEVLTLHMIWMASTVIEWWLEFQGITTIAPELIPSSFSTTHERRTQGSQGLTSVQHLGRR